MNYEEKYNDLLSRIKRMADVQPDVTRVAIESLFPELKESEDEKIRNFISNELACLRATDEKGSDRYEELTNAIAWLEKQKVLTTEEDLQGKEDVLWCIKQAEKYAKDENEMGTCWFAEKWLEKQSEQKPAEWSEEDEKIINKLIAVVELYYGIGNDSEKEKCLSWLKSLKDKVQPKVEWSEEDEKMFNRCVNTMKGAYYLDGEALYWLENRFKSPRPHNNITDEELAQAKKDAYRDALDKIEYHSGDPTFDDGWSAAIWYLKKRNTMPQSCWKPSELQIEALESATANCAYSEYEDCLKELINQLKQL